MERLGWRGVAVQTLRATQRASMPPCHPTPSFLSPSSEPKTHLHEQEQVRVLRLGGLSVSLFNVVVSNVDTHPARVKRR